jgi:acylpyruvate hydrolase
LCFQQQQIGRNYVDHAREMGAPIPSEPFWFFKPSTSYLRAPGASATPSASAVVHLPHGAEVHHEVELAAVIGARATRVRAAETMHHVAGYVCAVDLTARNWQADAKKKGQPWSRAKGCDTFLPVSEFVPVQTLPLPDPTMRARIWLRVNGQLRQDGNTDQMIFHLPDLVENITRHVTLEEWDLLLTGTPAGVGPLVHGDVVTAGIDNLVTLQFRCEQAPE